MTTSVTSAAGERLPPGEWTPYPFEAEPGRHVEARLAAGDEEQHAAGDDAHREPGRRCMAPASAPGTGRPPTGQSRQRGIEMAAGNVADSKRHREHGQAEGEGHSKQPDADVWESRRQNGAAASAENATRKSRRTPPNTPRITFPHVDRPISTVGSSLIRCVHDDVGRSRPDNSRLIPHAPALLIRRDPSAMTVVQLEGSVWTLVPTTAAATAAVVATAAATPTPL